MSEKNWISMYFWNVYTMIEKSHRGALWNEIVSSFHLNDARFQNDSLKSSVYVWFGNKQIHCK